MTHRQPMLLEGTMDLIIIIIIMEEVQNSTCSKMPGLSCVTAIFLTQYHGHIYLNLWHGICIANNGNNTETGLPVSVATVTYRLVNWSTMVEDEIESVQYGI